MVTRSRLAIAALAFLGCCLPLLAQEPGEPEESIKYCWAGYQDVYLPCTARIVNVAVQEPQQTFSRDEVLEILAIKDARIALLEKDSDLLQQKSNNFAEQLALERQRSEEYKVLAGAINKSWWRKSETWISVGIAAVSVLATR